MPQLPKPRPNKPFDGVTATRYDNGYYYNKVVFKIVKDHDMQVIFSNTKYTKDKITCYIPFFKEYTARDIINRITDYCVTPNVTMVSRDDDCYPWGRHFEDGIHDIWHQLGLKLGYVI